MTALFVVGFHRSGTSMIAESMAHAGAAMGDNLCPPDMFNAHGYFEDPEIVQFHDRVLRRYGAGWLYDGARRLELLAKDRAELTQLVAARAAKGRLWGFKDPRAALFIADWLRADDTARAVFVYRHWTECVASLGRRQA